MRRKALRLNQLTMPTYREILLDQVYRSVNCVKSFNLATSKLTVHYWYGVALAFHPMPRSSSCRPVHKGKRVTPGELALYRETHQFLGPGCLCPLLGPVSKRPTFIEAAIYIPVFGRYKGEYVAECAKSQCGFIGKASLS
jgi:hypothetical protein